MHARGAERICARARLELTRRGCRVVKPVAGEVVVIPFQVERVVPTRCKSSAANVAGASASLDRLGASRTGTKARGLPP